MGKELIKQLRESFTPVIEAQGCSLFDIEYIKENREWILRVFIDKEGGVGIKDCETISRALESVLDTDDPVPQAYVLEVSSPGIDHPIKTEADFIRHEGMEVDISLYRAVNNQKAYQGKLLGLRDETVSIEIPGGRVLSFKRREIALCKPAVIF